MRAEAYDYGSPESVALELFLMQRARGMTIETPGVRLAHIPAKWKPVRR